jgi:hypothetical protein
VHYTIGFTLVACLNLALLIPLQGHPLVDNYTILMCVAVMPTQFSIHRRWIPQDDRLFSSRWWLVVCDSPFFRVLTMLNAYISFVSATSSGPTSSGRGKLLHYWVETGTHWFSLQPILQNDYPTILPSLGLDSAQGMQKITPAVHIPHRFLLTL